MVEIAISEALDAADLLLQPNKIGNFRSFEATTIFLSTSNLLRNYFTIFVAEEGKPKARMARYLSPRLERISEDLSVGLIQFYGDPVGVLRHMFTVTSINGIYTSSLFSKSSHQKLIQTLPGKWVAPYFAPEICDLSKILKNNFGNGSHCIEYFVNDKSEITSLIKSPELLKKLSSTILKYLPIDLMQISDRIGNVIIQLPSTIAEFSVFPTDNDKSIRLDYVESPYLSKQSGYFLSAKTEFDKIILDSNYSQIQTKIIPLENSFGDTEIIISSSLDRTILARKSGNFVKHFLIDVRTSGQFDSPRTITIDGSVTEIHLYHTSQRGNPTKDTVGVIQDRINAQERDALAARLEFKQFQGPNQHAEAINDLRTLIKRHAPMEIMIWDPYLTAKDLLKTVYYCDIYDVKMRALSDFRKAGMNRPKLGNALINWISKRSFLQKLFSTWVSRRAAKLHEQSYAIWKLNERMTLNSNSNNLGIRMEFRATWGTYGREFHDRFLIFKGNLLQKSFAYSLGTSINSVGRSHHILQLVGNSDQIIQSFEEFWKEIEFDSCII